MKDWMCKNRSVKFGLTKKKKKKTQRGTEMDESELDRIWAIGKLNHKEVNSESETKMETETYSKSFNCRYFKNFECGTNGDDSFTAR